MLDEICDRLHNYFCEAEDIHGGDFTIAGGNIEPLSFLQNGQYFRIVGSVFNDGIYKYGANNNLKNEAFSGQIWALRIPPKIVNLATVTIPAWITANADALNSPFQSESFGGYSYSIKSGGSDGQGNEKAFDWWSQFYSELAPYKKVRWLT